MAHLFIVTEGPIVDQERTLKILEECSRDYPPGIIVDAKTGKWFERILGLIANDRRPRRVDDLCTYQLDIGLRLEIYD